MSDIYLDQAFFSCPRADLPAFGVPGRHAFISDEGFKLLEDTGTDWVDVTPRMLEALGVGGAPYAGTPMIARFTSAAWGDVQLVFEGASAVAIIKAVDGANSVFRWLDLQVDRLGINTVTPAYTLDVNGTFAATSKSFDIPYPGDPTKRLVHGSLEGPEHAVIYRGEDQLVAGVATITLPSYFEALTRPEHRSVLVTPKFVADEPISPLAASAVAVGQFRVRALDTANPTQAFYWEVKAVRGDVAPLPVVRPVAP